MCLHLDKSSYSGFVLSFFLAEMLEQKKWMYFVVLSEPNADLYVEDLCYAGTFTGAY